MRLNHSNSSYIFIKKLKFKESVIFFRFYPIQINRLIIKMHITNETCIHCFSHIPNKKYIYPTDSGLFINVIFEYEDGMKEILEQLYQDKNLIVSIVENVVQINIKDPIFLKIEGLRIFNKKTSEQTELLPKISKIVRSNKEATLIFININQIKKINNEIYLF